MSTVRYPPADSLRESDAGKILSARNAVRQIDACDTERIRQAVASARGAIGRKVDATVNHGRFPIVPEPVDDCIGMGRGAWIAANSFLRMRPGEALSMRKISPNIIETATDADKAAGD